jgi:hypothetical protein
MSHEPGIPPYVHLAVGVEATAVDDVSELHMGPQLTVAADPNIVINVKSGHGVEDYIASDPAIASDPQGMLTMPE